MTKEKILMKILESLLDGYTYSLNHSFIDSYIVIDFSVTNEKFMSGLNKKPQEIVDFCNNSLPIVEMVLLGPNYDFHKSELLLYGTFELFNDPEIFHKYYY